jgi:quercetin dioxygenase-like cupin family protein
MEIRHLSRDTMVRENGADGQRLVPWPALNAPFEGAWVVVPARGATGAHSHDDYEIFIAVTGEAVLESEHVRRPFRAGDIVHFPPGINHRVINDSDTEFEWYSVWWNPDMSAHFVDRHEGKA